MSKKKSFGMYLVKTKEGKYMYIDTKLKNKFLLERNPFYSKEIETGQIHMYNDFFVGNAYPMTRILNEKILNSEFFKKHAEEIYQLLDEEYRNEQKENEVKIQKKLKLRRDRKNNDRC